MALISQDIIVELQIIMLKSEIPYLRRFVFFLVFCFVDVIIMISKCIIFCNEKCCCATCIGGLYCDSRANNNYLFTLFYFLDFYFRSPTFRFYLTIKIKFISLGS